MEGNSEQFTLGQKEQSGDKSRRRCLSAREGLLVQLVFLFIVDLVV